jgi:hypothetical protein
MENLREEKGGGLVASHNLFPLAPAGPVPELVTYYVTNFPLANFLFFRGEIKSLSHNTLQTLAWRFRGFDT